MRVQLGALIVVVVVVLIITSMSLYIVDQRQNAIVFRLGEVVDVRKQPGLYFKLPLIDSYNFV